MNIDGQININTLKFTTFYIFLIPGYLKEERCLKTYNLFLTECVHLAEYTALLQRGRQYPTLLWGKSLKQILNEFGDNHLNGGITVPGMVDLQFGSGFD